jgi:hypothetical protein
MLSARRGSPSCWLIWSAGSLPDFELKLSVTVNHLKIGTVRGNKPSSMRSSRERDEYIKMEVAELAERASCVLINFPEYQARLQPIFLRRRQDGMVSLKHSQEFVLRGFRGATPQFGQNHRRRPDKTGD